MKRFFNTTGPCRADKHYMLPASERSPEVMGLIERGHYFVIHAPRQSGKTTMMMDLTQKINAAGHYYALYCSVETASVRHTVELGIPALISCLYLAVRRSKFLKNYAQLISPDETQNFSTLLQEKIETLCDALDRPLVIFFDEADGLCDELLISFLRQLRDGYINRLQGAPFPQSIALIGLRDLREYRVCARGGTQTLGSTSPFNIIRESRTLRNFTRDEIDTLYRQHTEETGQVFSAEVVDQVFELTRGQPWLVNAIACEIVEKICGEDTSKIISSDMARTAAQNIILRRDTHVDSLADKLRDPRVRGVIEPILQGNDIFDRLSVDFRYVMDLGLISDYKGMVTIANPIYNEVITRTLNFDAQMNMPQELEHRWIDAQAGTVDMNGLLREFQKFWRDNSGSARKMTEYVESDYHLVLSAFLQRVFNGGAQIAREYASGSGRVDICITYQNSRYALELKVRRDNRAKLLPEAKEQLKKYLNTLGIQEGWLLIFDQRPALPKKETDRANFEIDPEIGVQEPDWNKRLSWEDVQDGPYTLHILGV